jgi:hypothetical protein
MEEKIACTDCGAMILPSTAARNGGVCMPCKTGTRKSIESSKKHYAQERELDRTCPFRALWRELVDRVHNRPGGFEAFSEAEKQYYAVRVLVGEVYNGGFDQYFHNSSANNYRYAELGLMRIGATDSLALLRTSKAVVFGDDSVPIEQSQRRMRLKSMGDLPALDLLDSKFWTDPDSLDTKLERFAYEEGMVKNA